MTAARIVTAYVHAYCREAFPDEGRKLPSGTPCSFGVQMASTVCNGPMMDVFDYQSLGSYKYIPSDRLTADLEERQGAGVYGYWKMYDDSYVLLTCDGRLAHWSGKDEDKAEWGK